MANTRKYKIMFRDDSGELCSVVIPAEDELSARFEVAFHYGVVEIVHCAEVVEGKE